MLDRPLLPASLLSIEGLRAARGRVFHAAPPMLEEPASLPRSPSDFDLNPALSAEMSGVWSSPKPAAVLVPIIVRTAPTVLLTRRTDALPAHAGQIAFPGGKIEPGDRDEAAAALREAREEIGLDARFVEPLGYLDRYTSGTGYSIAPLVALIDERFSLAIDPSEVAEAFEVPLAFLLDEANHSTHSRPWRGAERRFHAMPYGDYYIWGVTAGIIRNLYERIVRA